MPKRIVETNTALAVPTSDGLLTMRANRVYRVEPNVAKRLVGAGVASYIDVAPAPAPAPVRVVEEPTKPVVVEDKPDEEPVVEAEKPKPEKPKIKPKPAAAKPKAVTEKKEV